jgi:drug/metabolite transporter (DMT)-like permease
MPSKHTNPVLPVLSLLLTAAMWGIVWYPLRLLEQNGLAGLWSSLISYGAALLVGLIWMSRKSWQMPARPWVLLLMMLAVGWCNVSFVLAILEGTVVRVLLLFYLSPLWALLLGWLMLGEKPAASAWIVFLLALLGALVMLWDEEIGMPWPKDRADWLAVSSGFAFSFANVMVRKMGSVDLSIKSVASWLGVVIVAIIWIVLVNSPLPDVTVSTLGGAVLLGWFGFVIMTITVVYGVTHMPVHRSAVILLFELVIGAVSSLLLTDEIIQPQEWIGGAMILISAYLAAREHIGETHETVS